MKNFYENTFACLNRYNELQDLMEFHYDSTTEEQDEFVINFPVYLAHALIKDTGFGRESRRQLRQAAEIIKAMCGE